MSAIFNKSSPFLMFLGLAVMAALWIPNFGDVPQIQDAPAMPLEILFMQWWAVLPQYASAFVPLAVLMFAALLIRLEYSHRIASQQPYAVALVFVLLCSAFPLQKAMNGVYPATLLFIAALFQIFRFYKEQNLKSIIFYAGILIGCAALFCASAIFFALLLIIALILFKQVFAWRDYLIAFAGLLSPFFYTCAINYFLYDASPFILFTTMYRCLFTLSPLIYENGYVTEKLYLAFIMFLMLQVFLLITKGLLTSKQSVKKIHVLLLWAFLILLGISLFLPAGSMLLMPLLAVPASILIANYFAAARNRVWAILQFIILIVFTFFARYYD